MAAVLCFAVPATRAPAYDPGAGTLVGTTSCVGSAFTIDVGGPAAVLSGAARKDARVWGQGQCWNETVRSRAANAVLGFTAEGLSCGVDRQGRLDGTFRGHLVQTGQLMMLLGGECTVDGVERTLHFFVYGTDVHPTGTFAGVLMPTE